MCEHHADCWLGNGLDFYGSVFKKGMGWGECCRGGLSGYLSDGMVGGEEDESCSEGAVHMRVGWRFSFEL